MAISKGSNKAYGSVFLTAMLCAICAFGILASDIAFAQSTTASVTGTVADATAAVVPGVSVIATNVNTGVVTEVLTNEVGVYQFASLQPGVYTISAKLEGFQPQTYKNVELQLNARVKLNFTLTIASTDTAVEVAATVDMLNEVSSTVGGVIANQKLLELPMTDLSALNLQATVGGVSGQAFAGSQSTSLNIARRHCRIHGREYCR
jgi:hypothetical protein